MSLQNEDIHNLGYATVQVIHNFGAVAVLGGLIVFIISHREATPTLKKRAAWVVLCGWTIQGISGAGFAVVSYLFYHHLPNIGAVGKLSLLIKILCTGFGFLLMSFYIIQDKVLSDKMKNAIWMITGGLAVIALSSAAFLRWFS